MGFVLSMTIIAFLILIAIYMLRHRRGSDGFHLNSRVCNLYETGDGSFIRGNCAFCYIKSTETLMTSVSTDDERVD